MDLATVRKAYAEELRYVAHVRSDRVIDAFATAAREHFLGPPPWLIASLTDGYWAAPENDPSAAYHNVLFAIDPARELNNGQPEFWARLLDKVDIRGGETIYHVGAGAGYYTAILAELAGAGGTVIAAEIDPPLGERARANFAGKANIRVEIADGANFDPGPVDVIVINAGVTHPVPLWLASLKPGGRMLLPMTADNTWGTVFLIERIDASDAWRASVVSGVGIYPCAGARAPAAARLLTRAIAGGGQRFVRSLRLEAHEAEPRCWLHGAGYCLSTREVRMVDVGRSQQ